MGHSMLKTLFPVVHLPGSMYMHPHILPLISAAARAQASLSCGQAKQTTAAVQGGNDCDEKSQCNESTFTSASESNPNSTPSSVATSQLTCSAKATYCNHRCPPQHSLASILLTRQGAAEVQNRSLQLLETDRHYEHPATLHTDTYAVPYILQLVREVGPRRKLLGVRFMRAIDAEEQTRASVQN